MRLYPHEIKFDTLNHSKRDYYWTPCIFNEFRTISHTHNPLPTYKILEKAYFIKRLHRYTRWILLYFTRVCFLGGLYFEQIPKLNSCWISIAKKKIQTRITDQQIGEGDGSEQRRVSKGRVLGVFILLTVFIFIHNDDCENTPLSNVVVAETAGVFPDGNNNKVYFNIVDNLYVKLHARRSWDWL